MMRKQGGTHNATALAIAIAVTLLAVVGDAHASNAPAIQLPTRQPSPLIPATQNTKSKRHPTATGAGAATKPTKLSEIVVTGAATVRGVSLAKASYSITTLSRSQIKIANPTSLADLMRQAPGVYAEASGGETGANVEVGGFPSDSGAPFVTTEINGLPLPIGTSIPAQAFRLDDTIEGVQMLQGGPTAIFDGQAGLVTNFQLRQGTETPTGEVAVTGLSEGGARFDGFYGFPISTRHNWFGSVGGFWEDSNGVRDPQYTANHGGQVTFTVSHHSDNSSLNFYVRDLKIGSQFVTDTPILNPRTGEFKPYPGFNPLTGSVSSSANRLFSWPSAPCDTLGCTPPSQTFDMADGRGSTIHIFGADTTFDFPNSWMLTNKFSFLGGYFRNVGFYSSSTNPEPLDEYIGTQTKADALPGGLLPVVQLKTDGGLVGVSNLGQPVMVFSPRITNNHPIAFNDEVRLTKFFGNVDSLTLGAYFAHMRMQESAQEGLRMLLQARSNPFPVVLGLTNGVDVYQLTNSDGVFYNPSFSATQNSMDSFVSKTAALFVSNQLMLGKFTVSLGGRLNHKDENGYFRGIEVSDADANPKTVYNNSTEFFSDARNFLRRTTTVPSWTGGVSYQAGDNVSTYARFTHASIAPGFGRSVETDPISKTTSSEVGVKFATSRMFLNLSVYHRTFNGLVFNVTTAGGELTHFVYGADTKGVNLQGSVSPIEHLDIQFNTDFMDGHYSDLLSCVTFISQLGTKECQSPEGKILDRQPKFQYSIRPLYTIPEDWGRLRFWASLLHVGYHFGNTLNSQILGQYNDVGIGAEAFIGKHWQLTLRGSNVTNQIGLTEGNARDIGSSNAGGVIMARSILGHEYNFQVKYIF